MVIRQRFDVVKALEVLSYIVSKILYVADKEHLAKYGRSICGDSYVATRHGPVPGGFATGLESLSLSDRECLDNAIDKSLTELQDSSADEAFRATRPGDVIPLEAIVRTLPDGESLLEHLRGR